jgi:dCMP deaminase
MHPSANCEYCKQPFSKNIYNKRYCSELCAGRARRERNREKTNANWRERYKRVGYAEHIKRKYGLTLPQYEALAADGCAVCGIKVGLVVDHDHDTGKVRGVLCVAHNAGIGSFHDSPEELLHAIKYLASDGQERVDWDRYFLWIAGVIAVRGDCTNRQVGAVIVGEDHRVIEVGYNGAPSGEPGCLSDGACPRSILRAEKPRTGDYDECISVHAESNAVVLAGRRARGGTIYVTDWPCGGCTKLIRAVGIVRIVTPNGEEL